MTDPFIDAVRRGDREAVERMLAADRRVLSTRDENGTSPLLLAHYHGRTDVAKTILANQPDLDLYEAATVGDADRIREIVATNERIVDESAPDGFTALGLAAFFKRPAAVRTLLDLHADPHLSSRQGGFAPLHSAVADGAAVASKDIVRMLLDAGADPNARSATGDTPLHTAAFTGDVEIARLLLAAGANANITDAEGLTPLDVARDRDHSEVAALLHDAVVGKRS